MELETPYEFPGRERHRCSLPPLFVVLQTKGHRPFIPVDVKDTVVAGGYLMRVASQIFDHMFRPPKRWLGIDHPLFFEQIVI